MPPGRRFGGWSVRSAGPVVICSHDGHSRIVVAAVGRDEATTPNQTSLPRRNGGTNDG